MKLFWGFWGRIWPTSQTFGLSLENVSMLDFWISCYLIANFCATDAQSCLKLVKINRILSSTLKWHNCMLEQPSLSLFCHHKSTCLYSTFTFSAVILIQSDLQQMLLRNLLCCCISCPSDVSTGQTVIQWVIGGSRYLLDYLNDMQCRLSPGCITHSGFY